MKTYKDSIKNIVGYFFAAYGCALVGNILAVLFTRESEGDFEDMRKGIKDENMHMKTVDNINCKNSFRVTVLLIINLSLTALLFYAAIGFSAYYKQYTVVLEVGLAVLIGVDFLLFDVIITLLMALLFKAKCTCMFTVLNIFKFTRCL